MVKRCREPFSVWKDGVPIVYTAGQLVDDKDRILKTHSALFEDVEAAARPRAAAKVEAATAEPGTARSLTPPTEETSGPGDEPFNPDDHPAPEVIAYLEAAEPDEVRRVLDAEAAGKARKGILGERDKLLGEQG